MAIWRTLTKELAEMIVHSASSKKDRIIKAIEKEGFEVVDESEEFGYMNLKVWNRDGSMIRIYRPDNKRARVQLWKPFEYVYSGIPTFEPSGRRSL